MPQISGPCQLDLVRFTPVQARRSSRVTGSAYLSPFFFRFMQETGFPVGSYKGEAFAAFASAPAAASAFRLVHPLTNVVRNSVDGSVLMLAVTFEGPLFPARSMTALHFFRSRVCRARVVSAQRAAGFAWAVSW
ncbi:hypothetical protein ACPCVL_28250 [Streptomyces koyangensis]|uniref:hypothetical protein n=1 Tax=Streptomyces koyangensis TaxID=188770 RepID=UPI003C2E192B